MGALSYTERDAVTQGDRKFSEVALGWDGEEFVPSGSGTIEEGRVTVAAPPATITQLFNERYGIPGRHADDLRLQRRRHAVHARHRRRRAAC